VTWSREFILTLGNQGVNARFRLKAGGQLGGTKVRFLGKVPNKRGKKGRSKRKTHQVHSNGKRETCRIEKNNPQLQGKG